MFGVWGVMIFVINILLLGCTLTPESLTHIEGQSLTQPQPRESGQISAEFQQSLSEPQIQTPPEPEPMPRSTTQTQSEPGVKPVQEIPILYYHSIAEEAGNELRIPAEEFDSHMKFLRQAGYQSITLHELYQHFYEGWELPRKPFVLTFDDGYADNFSNAFRIAKKYGFNGTIFMVTGWIDGEGYLTKEQLLEMSKAGWQIEAHTVSHPKLNELTSKQLEFELKDSKKKLEELLNTPVMYLAYPYGSYTEQVIQEAKGAGYLMGFTTERGWAKGKEPYQVHRVYCYANMGVEELKRRVEDPSY